MDREVYVLFRLHKQFLQLMIIQSAFRKMTVSETRDNRPVERQVKQ